MRIQVTVRDGEAVRDVVLAADPETPAADVLEALGVGCDRPVFVRGRMVYAGGTFAQTAILDGDALDVGRQSRAFLVPDAPAQLVLTSGPLAGMVVRFERDDLTVGRGRDNDVVLADPLVSASHMRVTRDGGGGVTVADLGSSNGVFVDGERIGAARTVPAGAAIVAGSSVFEVRPPPERDADVQPDDDGRVAFNRPPRLRDAPLGVTVQAPRPVMVDESWPFPWAAAVIPVVIAVLMAVLLKRPEMMLFAVMSPVLAVSSAMTTRKRSRQRTAREQERFDRELAQAHATITDAVERQTAARRMHSPDPATVADIALLPTRRLWERRAHDLDALELRVGVGDEPADVAIQGDASGSDLATPTLRTVPIVLPLRACGVIGLAGKAERVRAAARWLVAQTAALHAPSDLAVVLLTDNEAGDDWGWFRWLPHARSDDPNRPLAWIGNDTASREERVRELLQVLDARREAGDARDMVFTPAIVVVLDGARQLRALPGVPRLLRDGPSYGMYVIGLDDDPTRLPEEARAEVVLDDHALGRATVNIDGHAPKHDVIVDMVSAHWAERVARSLAPVRSSGGEEADEIPTSVRFLDLAGINVDDPSSIHARWLLGGRSTAALVGASIDGPFSLDLKRDGPHALVAGTTGAGKSEFLQTLVASLAIANRPDAMQFVLVDYKGASAFADCARLPHTVGMVTNLDGHLTERALVSLDAELKRREHALAELHAPDVDAAWERDAAAASCAGLARLVLVIDEFAELVQELPDFITGLIRIARVGRSLGIHLVLATQRPAGVVTPEMRANTGLRVALRMEDKNDSVEVLEAPHAATISRATPGRGYVRTGTRAALVQFQTARVAGRRRGLQVAIEPPAATPVRWTRLGYPPPVAEAHEPEAMESTDLHALVTALCDAASRLDLPAAHAPWLEPLPDALTLDDLTTANDASAHGMAAVGVGIEDVPSEQWQGPLLFDVVHGSHWIIAGSARSGRSTALRAVAAAVTRAHAPADLHVYGFDFGNGALRPVADLPHCGAVVTATETERVERLVRRLIDELERRQQLLADGGFGDITEQRAVATEGGALPFVVVLVDRWEGLMASFRAADGSDVPELVGRLVREGPSAGFRLVLAGDRSLLTDRIATQIEHKILLRLSDANDYRIVDIRPSAVPEDMPPGRGLRAQVGTEVQFALLDRDASGPAQAKAMRAIAQLHEPPPASSMPIHVDVLPRRMPLADARMLPAPDAASASTWLLVGAGGDRLQQLGIDVARHSPGFVVAGSRGSGRTSTLVLLALGAAEKGHHVVFVSPQRPIIEPRLLESPSIKTLTGADARDPDALAGAIGDAAAVVVVDDAEFFARSEADDRLNALAGEPGRLTSVIVGGTTDDLRNEIRGVIVSARRSAAGILLSPASPLDGDVFGMRLERTQLGGNPGRGLLRTAGEPVPVQVASLD